MALFLARFLKKDSQSLKANASDELEVKIKSGGFLQRTVDGLEVIVNDTVSALTNLWTSKKISDELATKASISYVDNAIAGLKWKAPVINFITQATLDGLSPQTGDRYIITDGIATNEIAQYNGVSWDYATPSDNWTVMRKSDDKSYTFDADTSAWVATSVGQTESEVVEEFTLSAGDITAKKVTLTYTPVNANYVKLDILGGCAQDNGTDFTVNVGTKEVGWSGTGLDGLLAANDVLRISYSKMT
jgi:hypothetical protein